MLRKIKVTVEFITDAPDDAIAEIATDMSVQVETLSEQQYGDGYTVTDLEYKTEKMRVI